CADVLRGGDRHGGDLFRVEFVLRRAQSFKIGQGVFRVRSLEDGNATAVSDNKGQNQQQLAQSCSEEEPVAEETRPSTKISGAKSDSRLPAIEQTSVKQKHKSTMTPRKLEKAGPSKPSPGDNSEHPLFCVEYSPYCSVFAFSPTLQPNTNYCCLLLPLVPPASPAASPAAFPAAPPAASPAAQDPCPHFPQVPFLPFPGPPSASPLSPTNSSLGPGPESPASLCYFPISRPTPAETPVLCLPGPRRPSRIYLMCQSRVRADLEDVKLALKGLLAGAGRRECFWEGGAGLRRFSYKRFIIEKILHLPAIQAPQILSKKRRPNLGRLTVSPERQSLRAAGERGRPRPQLPPKAPALKGADSVAQQESLMWTSDTKLKRMIRERRRLVPSSQKTMVTDNTPERAKKGDPSALPQNEPPPALSQVFLGTNSPHSPSSESLGPPLTATMGGPRRAPFRFRDEDFYSVLSLNTGREDDDTDEETQEEEELLLVGMHALHSPSSHKRSPFLGASTTLSKNKNFEGHPENCRAHCMRGEPVHSSLRLSQVLEPAPEQLPLGPSVTPEPVLPDGVAAKENPSDDSEDEEKAFDSWDTKSKTSLDESSAEDVPSDRTSLGNRPGLHDYERDWQVYLNSSSSSLDYFLSGRPTPPRASMSSSYNTAGSLMPSVLSNNFPVDPRTPPTSAHSSDAEGNSRFSVRQPLSPIKNRNPPAKTDNHSHLPVDNAPEFDVRGAEDTTLTNQSQGAPLYTGRFLVNPRSSSSLEESSSSSPPGMNLQGHLHMSGSLQENIPLTLLTLSNFPNHSSGVSRMAVSGSTDKEATKTKADPEKLKKLQESLLEEDSEEEGDSCRICQIAGGSPTNPLLEPCGCVGSLQFVHQECLKKWLKVKITSGADLGAIKTCEMCKQGLLVDLDDFNVTELYQKHQQSRAQNELMNSGLYLVLLLHLYEQRFAELMRLNYNRVARERVSVTLPHHPAAAPTLPPLTSCAVC
ncbi:putative E3 ubiquitin-protein ligase MARCH10, partial [Galemys pyrenaicus]